MQPDHISRQSEVGSAGADPRPAAVPVFNCIIYLATEPDGTVLARVANLGGLDCTATSERDALRKLVPAFKARLAELTNRKAEIPWIDPPAPAKPGEQIRYVPVHL